MIYNGFDFTPYFIDEQIRDPLLPEIADEVVDVPGVDGQLYNGTTYQPRVIEIDVRIIRETRRELDELIPFIASKLNAREPSRLYTRLYSGEYYIAKLTGIGEWDKWQGTAGNTLTFTAYDPMRYCDREIVEPLTYAAKNIEIMGTYKTFPTITIDIPAAATYVAVNDLTTGLQIRSEYSFKAGNRVVFECGQNYDVMKVALLYATASASTAVKVPVTPQSRWFELEPGIHNMRLLSSASSVTGSLRYLERRV